MHTAQFIDAIEVAAAAIADDNVYSTFIMD